MVILTLSEKVLIIQEFTINYEKGEATLIALNYLITKDPIDERWKIQPLFANKNSLHTIGIIIYQWQRDGDWMEVINMENFKDEDYISFTDVGSVGYKIYDNITIKSASTLLLHCKLNPNFSKRIDHYHR